MNLSDQLVDGSTVATDFDSQRRRFRTTHTTMGATKEVQHWQNSSEARAGHSRTVRELTAAIPGTREVSNSEQRHRAGRA